MSYYIYILSSIDEGEGQPIVIGTYGTKELVVEAMELIVITQRLLGNDPNAYLKWSKHKIRTNTDIGSIMANLGYDEIEYGGMFVSKDGGKQWG